MEYSREWHHQAFREYMTKRGPVALTVAEIAELLNVSQRHIYKLVAENQIPHVKIGGSVRFDAKDISDWIGKKIEEQEKGTGRKK